MLDSNTNTIKDQYSDSNGAPLGEMVNGEVIYITNEDYISTDENTSRINCI